MIHVQIASDITTVGVEGVRWVLVEPSDAEPLGVQAPELAGPEVAVLGAVVPAPAPTAAAPPQPLEAKAPPAGSGRRIHLWQMAIIGLGLMAALGTAQRQWGPPTLPWLTGPEPSPPLAVPPPVLAPPAPASPAASDAAGVIAAPADRDARPQADLPAADNPVLMPAEPSASAAQPERLITAGWR